MSAPQPSPLQITLRTREAILKQFQETRVPDIHSENALLLEVLLDLRDLSLLALGLFQQVIARADHNWQESSEPATGDPAEPRGDSLEGQS